MLRSGDKVASCDRMFLGVSGNGEKPMFIVITIFIDITYLKLCVKNMTLNHTNYIGI